MSFVFHKRFFKFILIKEQKNELLRKNIYFRMNSGIFNHQIHFDF